MPSRRAVIDAIAVPHDIRAVVAKRLHLLRKRDERRIQFVHAVLIEGLQPMEMASRLDRRQRWVGVLRHGKMLVENSSFEEEAHEVRHQGVAMLLHRRP